MSKCKFVKDDTYCSDPERKIVYCGKHTCDDYVFQSDEIKNKCDCQYCRQVEQIEKLTAQLEANKNCLNCQSYYFDEGTILKCKQGRKYQKVCDEWRQL